MVTRPVLVAGTGAWDADGAVDWYCPGHVFGQFLVDQGTAPLFDEQYPFIWSTNLSGFPFFSRPNHLDWKAGAAALAYYVIAKKKQPGSTTALIVHSHGLQVALYACALFNLKVRCLISIGSPVRGDMMATAEAAKPNIAHWQHVHSDHSDRWQWLGALFDGHFGIVRKHPLADANDFVPHVGHSELLRKPEHYHHWIDRGWLRPILDTPSTDERTS